MKYQKYVRFIKKRLPTVISNRKTDKEELRKRLDEIKGELLNSMVYNEVKDSID